MAIVLAEFWPETVLGTSATLLFTAPNAGSGAWLKRAVFTNVTGSNVTITVYKVPSSGTPGTGNILIDPYTLVGGGEPYVPQSMINLAMTPGGFIYALCSAVNSVNTTASGFTF